MAQILGRLLHVGDDQVQALLDADRHVADLRDVATQQDGAAGSGRADLHDPHVVQLDVIGEQPPAALVDIEVAGAVDVADG